MTKQEKEEKSERIENALERCTKSVESNMKLIRSALWDKRHKEAEKWRRHAFESFEEIAELLKELL